MKKYICLFLAATALITGCDDDEKDPGYSAEPHIEFSNLEFVDTGGTDSLIVTFRYQDGDMDLGLNYEGVDIDSPFHHIDFFLEDGLRLTSVSSRVISGPEASNIVVLNLAPHTHKRLVTLNTRATEPFGYLPDKNYPFYSSGMFIAKKDQFRINEPYTVMDIVTIGNEDYLQLSDLLYAEENPLHHNIKVSFLVAHDDGSYTEYDWFKEFYQSFNGRFPRIPFTRSGPFAHNRLSDNTGEIRYSMASIGFQTLFRGKKIKLKIQVMDRAQNLSNTIETETILIP